MAVRLGLAAAFVVAALALGARWYASQAVKEVGFAFANGTYALDEALADRFGGALADDEMREITRRSRVEVERAFSGLNVRVTERGDVFWSVRVVPSIPRRRNQQLPAGGQTLALGILGGKGLVDFQELAAASVVASAGRPCTSLRMRFSA
jgi:hypothetical protein